MNLEHASTGTSTDQFLHSLPDTHLHGRRLILARAFWGVVAILELAALIDSLTGTISHLQVLCTSSCTIQQLSAAAVSTLEHVGLSLGDYIAFYLVVILLSTLLCYAIATLLLWRRSDDWMALLVSLMLMSFGPGIISNGVRFSQWFEPAVAPHVSSLFDSINLTVLVLVFFLFPDSRFVPRWTRWIMGLQIGFGIFFAFFPRFTSDLANSIAVVFFLGILFSLVIAQVYRYQRVSTLGQRQQTKWVVYSLVVSITSVVGLLVIFQPQPGSLLSALDIVANLLLTLIPISLAVAILRYRLWDIDLLINRTLVYGTLTACIIGLYILVVGYLGALFRTGNNLLISLVATGLVAVLFQPLRERLQRGVNRLLYGQRDEPSRVISRLGQRLEATLAPEAVLPTIVETLAQALKLPYAAILLKRDDAFTEAASFGNPQGEMLTLPLVYQRESIGKLLLAPRAVGEDFTPADLRLLNELTRQVSLAAHAVRLTTDLQRLAAELQSSRIQLVTTREEERRRLRRDLHDGLGSALTGVTFQLDAASNLLDRDPQAVKVLLKELKAQTQASIADIRRLVYNLRPPILDEWGLVAALREQVAPYQLDSVQVTIDAPESLPTLPAAIEVAAYRIALEALANVIRHAQASTCTIRLSICEDTLTVEVQDNGHGLPSSYHAGVGINAMRERAAELGGACTVERLATGGSRVSARLPLLKEWVPYVE
ncbi:MAG TPA: GAF domain-containing sensor histidine kinase [Ktedonobacteraceae bacterium]